VLVETCFQFATSRDFSGFPHHQEIIPPFSIGNLNRWTKVSGLCLRSSQPNAIKQRNRRLIVFL
jgi:hypothetical protein